MPPGPKRDEDLEEQALAWIEAVLNEKFDRSIPYDDLLRNGVILCRDPEAEQEAQEWIEACIGEKFPSGDYGEALKNGVILCKLINALQPGSVKKYVEKGLDFKLMENIAAFQGGAKKYGIREDELFQTCDLWTKKNIPSVTKCVHALGRLSQTKSDWKGPTLGPKMADQNTREFTEEQMKEGQYVVNTFQMGYAGGASQAGMNLGKQRSVLD